MSGAGIADWLDLMPLTVQIAPYLGRTSYGVASYGPAVGYRARVNYEQHYVRDKSGATVVSTGVAWIANTSEIDVDDRIILPDGSTPIVLKAGAETDETGKVLYTRIDFG